MAVSLSIKDVPQDLARALRLRAERNHRSLQGELMHILEAAVRPRPFDVDSLIQKAQALGIKSTTSSVPIIRKLRDSR